MKNIAVILIFLGGLLCLANWFSIYQSVRTKRFHSAIPFFGAAYLGGGMLLLPATRYFAWLAIIIDYGTLSFILALPHLVREMYNTSRFNLLHEYTGRLGNRSVRVALFRKGIFTIRINIDRPKNECGLVSTGTIGTWYLQEGELAMKIAGEDSAFFSILTKPEAELLHQKKGFPRFEANAETSLAEITMSKVSKTKPLNP